MTKKRVMVLMGGRSSEHAVSLVSGRGVTEHLDKSKYEVLPVVLPKDGNEWKLVTKEELMRLVSDKVLKAGDNKIVGKKLLLEEIPSLADVVFIAMHGHFGEDGILQGLLEMIGLPYTGAGVLASAVGMDKLMFKKVMESEKVVVPRYLIVEKGKNEKEVLKKFKLPVVVKPSSEGSSVGVSIVHKEQSLRDAFDKAFEFGTKIIVEEYVSGMEISCGVLGNEKPLALPIVEIVPKNEFFDYEAKYSDGVSEEIVPARISDQLTKAIQNTAIKVYRAIGCQGFGRVDMIIKNNQPYVLEINTIPGLTPNSLLPKEAAAAGISYSQLLDRLINLALEKD